MLLFQGVGLVFAQHSAPSEVVLDSRGHKSKNWVLAGCKGMNTENAILPPVVFRLICYAMIELK